MPIQIFDENNQPVTNVNVVVSNQTQLLDSQNNLINPAKEDGNLQILSNKIDTNLSTRATEVTLQSVNTNLEGIAPKIDAITAQLSTQVRGLFDNNGNPITSILVPIFGYRGISNVNISLDQYLTFNKRIFYYFIAQNVNANDTKIIALVNPSNSTKTFFIRRISIARNLDNNNSVFFYIRTNAQGITGTPVNQNNIVSTLSGGTSVSNIYTTPNYTSAGSTRFVIGLNAYEGSRESVFEFGFGLNPGENLFMIGNATSNGTPCFITIEWAEV